MPPPQQCWSQSWPVSWPGPQGRAPGALCTICYRSWYVLKTPTHRARAGRARARNTLLQLLYSTLQRTSHHSGGPRNFDTLVFLALAARYHASNAWCVCMLLHTSNSQNTKCAGYNTICVWSSEPLPAGCVGVFITRKSVQILGRNGRFLFWIFYGLKIELLLNLVPCTVDLFNG
jgi:hypothetical protein